MACTWRSLLHFAIIRGAIQKGRLLFWIFCQFSPFRWSNFDFGLIYFTLSRNTSSYSPMASGTYNPWKVDFKKKKKNWPKHHYNAGYGRTLYNAAWWFPFLYILDHCWKCVAKVCVFWFNAAFNSFPVISRRCLVATGSSMRACWFPFLYI